MAGSLIPDVGNISANTTGAMQNYLSAVKDYGSSMEKPADTLNNYIKNMLDQKRIEEDMALKRSAESRAQTELGMQQAERDRINNERTVTNNALQATINPKAYGADKMAIEQKAIQSSLANLSPEERVIAEQQIKANYDPFASEKGWLDNAINTKGVDVGKVFDAKNKDYEMKAKTPGTPEFIAAQNAAFDLYSKQEALRQKNALAVEALRQQNNLAGIQQQFDNSWKLADKPIIVYNEEGDSKSVSPSKIGDPENKGYMTADMYTAKNKLAAEQLEKDRDYKLKLQDFLNKSKKDLADTLTEYNSGSKEAVINSTVKANELIANYNEAHKKDKNFVAIPTISASDLTSNIKTSRTWHLPFKNEDLNTDQFRKLLAGQISSKIGMKPEDVLRQLEGSDSVTSSGAVSNATKEPTVGVGGIGNVMPSNTHTNTGSKLTDNMKKPDTTPTSFFGIEAPTAYDPITGKSTYKPHYNSEELKAKEKYDLLPEYIKKDVSLDKYMERPSAYEYLLKK